MTNQEVYNEIKDFRKEFADYIKCHNKDHETLNEKVTRHDEKIKSIWKIPIISGAVIAFISAVGVFLSFVIH